MIWHGGVVDFKEFVNINFSIYILIFVRLLIGVVGPRDLVEHSHHEDAVIDIGRAILGAFAILLNVLKFDIRFRLAAIDLVKCQSKRGILQVILVQMELSIILLGYRDSSGRVICDHYGDNRIFSYHSIRSGQVNE